MVSGSISLRYSRYFSPFPHGTSSLSVSQKYLALPDGPGRFTQGFPCPVLLRIPLSITVFTCTGLSPSMVLLSSSFQFIKHRMSWSYNPSLAVTRLVWAFPRSLAATNGITIVFYSSGYLDVSVPRVRLLHLCIQCKIPVKGGFPHSEISGSKSVCRLPEAYRRLLRPSSPLTAKASTVCA